MRTFIYIYEINIVRKWLNICHVFQSCPHQNGHILVRRHPSFMQLQECSGVKCTCSLSDCKLGHEKRIARTSVACDKIRRILDIHSCVALAHFSSKPKPVSRPCGPSFPCCDVVSELFAVVPDQGVQQDSLLPGCKCCGPV